MSLIGMVTQTGIYIFMADGATALWDLFHALNGYREVTMSASFYLMRLDGFQGCPGGDHGITKRGPHRSILQPDVRGTKGELQWWTVGSKQANRGHRMLSWSWLFNR